MNVDTAQVRAPCDDFVYTRHKHHLRKWKNRRRARRVVAAKGTSEVFTGIRIDALVVCRHTDGRLRVKNMGFGCKWLAMAKLLERDGRMLALAATIQESYGTFGVAMDDAGVIRTESRASPKWDFTLQEESGLPIDGYVWKPLHEVEAASHKLRPFYADLLKRAAGDEQLRDHVWAKLCERM